MNMQNQLFRCLTAIIQSYYSKIQFPRTVKKQNTNKKSHSTITALAWSLDSSPSSYSVWIVSYQTLFKPINKCLKWIPKQELSHIVNAVLYQVLLV